MDLDGDGLISHGELDAFVNKSRGRGKVKAWQLGPYQQEPKDRKYHSHFVTEAMRQYTGQSAIHDAEAVGMRNEVWGLTDRCIYQSSAPLARFDYVKAFT